MFLSLALLLVSGYSYAQTTQEEYNYCTKGYAHQLSMGLDPVKAGYEIKKLFTWQIILGTQSSTTIDFVGMFYQGNKNAPKATIIVLKKNAETPKYFCMTSLGTDYNIASIANGLITTVPLLTWAMNDYCQYMQLPANLRTNSFHVINGMDPSIPNTKTDDGPKGLNFDSGKGNGQIGTNDGKNPLPTYGSGKCTQVDGVSELYSGRNCIQNCAACNIRGVWEEIGDAYIVIEVTPAGKVVSSRLADVKKYPSNAQFFGRQKVIAENCAMQRVYNASPQLKENIYLVAKISFN